MKVSVVTPSFRQLEWLQLCIASIADQQGVEVEHIVQDAGTPGFAEFSREMERRWPTRPGYSRHMVSEPDEGMYDAVNRGLLKAKGEVLAYLNCDEQYLAGTLGRVVHWFGKNPEQEVLFGDAIIVDSAGGYLCSRRAMVPQPLHTLTSGNLSIFTSSTFFRKRLWDRGLIFEKKWKDVGDADWALRVIGAGMPCQAPGNCLSVFTDTGENRNMRSQARQEKEALRRSAPTWAQILAPLILVAYRIQRWRAGAYRRRLVDYAIYTKQTPTVRREFGPFSSVARWPGRP